MKKTKRPYYKDVQLISEDNPIFVLYKSQFRTDRPTINHEKVRMKSQIISGVLERVTREWVKSSNDCLNENILCFERLNKKENTYDKKIKEIDYIFKRGNNFVIGEVKVSNQDNGNASTAYQQLSLSKTIMKSLGNVSEMEVILIDLNFKNATEPLDTFESDFSKTKFQTKENETGKFMYVHISAEDIFKWGVEKGIVKEPKLLDAALDEAELLNKSRKLKQELKEKKKVNELNPTQEINDEIKELEKNILLYSIKTNLYQKGWEHLPDMSEETLKKIFTSLGDIILTTDVVVKPDSKALVTSERGLDFHTDHHKAKYIAWHCIKQTDKGGETILIDAEKVYQRLSEQHKKELESIELFEHKVFEDDPDKIPLVNNKGRRKFYYSFWLVNKEQKENSALKEFQRIIKEAELFKFHLQPNDVLLIDNHRIFHGRTAIEGSKDRFLKRFWLQANSTNNH